jgi:glutamine synthetase
MSVNLANWIAEHKIDEVECIVPDINGVQRGKVLPARNSFPRSATSRCAFPAAFSSARSTGNYPEDIEDIWDKDPDKTLIADPIRSVSRPASNRQRHS